MKLYRIHIIHMDDPLQNQRLLELVSPKRREKVIRYRMPDDRKRSLGAGIILREILRENGLNESDLRYSENEKPVADSVFFNVSHAGDYVVGVSSDCEVGCDIEKIRKEAGAETNERCRLLQEDYVRLLQELGTREAITRRFFLIFQKSKAQNFLQTGDRMEFQSLFDHRIHFVQIRFIVLWNQHHRHMFPISRHALLF